MAITPWQTSGILNPQEYFGQEEYGRLGPKITTPSLLGAGVLGDVAGKGPKTQRGLKCPTGTQPNASNTACVPIQKTGTCPAGTTGVWPNCTPIKVGGGTCPAGTTGVWPNCTRIKVGNGTDPTCASLNKVGTYPNCRDPITTTDQQCGDGEVGRWPNCRPAQNLTEDDLKNLFDLRTDDPTTVADVGRVRQDPMTGQTITSTGISMADAARNYGLTPEESYRVTYSPYGAEERGLGAARGTWNPLSDPVDLAARQAANIAAGGILSQSAFTPAPLSTEDFLAQYSRPPKTVDQGILSPSQEAAAVGATPEARQRAEEFSGSRVSGETLGPSYDQGILSEALAESQAKEAVRKAKDRSKAQKSAKKKLAEIQIKQAEEKAASKRRATEKQMEDMLRQMDETRQVYLDRKAKEEENRRRAGYGVGAMYT